MNRRDGWTVIEREEERWQAVVPSDEEILHDLFSDVCRCNVRTHRLKTDWTVYTHQAFDHREVDEWLATRHH